MFKFLITLSIGIYAGIYISQNYEIPRVDEPTKIIERIKEIADEYKKKIINNDLSNNTITFVEYVFNPVYCTYTFIYI